MNAKIPDRCCAPATSGRCSNAPAPHGQSRYIGPVEIAACNQPKHQAALRSLPGFTRRDGVCGADGCGKPIPLGLCPDHRHLYQRHGVSIRALLATEPTMPAPAPAPGAQPTTDDAIEPSAGDVAEAAAAAAAADVEAATVDSPFPGRWGQQHSALPEGPPARGHEPTAPGPTLADMQARAIAAEQRADRAELDAVSERARGDQLGEDAATQRARAEAAEAQLSAIAEMLDPEDSPAWDANDQPIPLPTRVQVALMPTPMQLDRESELRATVQALSKQLSDVDNVLHWLGSYGNVPTVERLMKVLSVEDRRNIWEFRASTARTDIVRLKVRRLNPPPEGRMAELAADLAKAEAALAALPSLPPSTTPLADDLGDLVARIRCDLQPTRGGQDVATLEGIYNDLRSVAERLAGVEAPNG